MRYKNPKILNEMAKKPCEICKSHRNNSAHHIITRARQGGDHQWNLITLCFDHHREIHDKPLSEFIEKYPFALKLFEDRGFIWDDNFKRLYRMDK